MNNENWNILIGKFAFHLYDTHGFPKEEFERNYIKDGYFEIEAILKLMLRHRDFIKEQAND